MVMQDERVERVQLAEMRERLSAIEDQLADLRDQRNELRHQIAQALATVKIGDRVTYRGAKKIWQIARISPGHDCLPRYYGLPILKSGAPGRRDQAIYLPYKVSLELVPDGTTK